MCSTIGNDKRCKNTLVSLHFHAISISLRVAGISGQKHSQDGGCQWVYGWQQYSTRDSAYAIRRFRAQFLLKGTSVRIQPVVHESLGTAKQHRAKLQRMHGILSCISKRINVKHVTCLRTFYSSKAGSWINSWAPLWSTLAIQSRPTLKKLTALALRRKDSSLDNGRSCTSTLASPERRLPIQYQLANVMPMNG